MIDLNSLGLPGMPLASITSSDMWSHRTGSWRHLRPRFVHKLSPCGEACPAGNDIAGFMILAGQGQYQGALEKILWESPFPGVCGRVCYHPCESACNRTVLDEPISIQGIERFVAEQDVDPPFAAPAPHREKIAVVGAGPAGLSCAYHLARLGHRATVFEKEVELGGMLRQGIPRYRLPRDILDREIDRILNLGVTAELCCRVGSDISWNELLGWDAIFLAIGAHGDASLQSLGGAGDKAVAGLDFLRTVNAGRPLDLGERIAVIGGGNTAIDCARAAVRLGAKPVIVYRRTREEMPAIPSEVEEASEEGIELLWLTSPVSIRVADGRIVGLECVKNRLGAPGKDGRRRPEPIPDSLFMLDVDCVITAIGEVVSTEDLPSGLEIPSGVVEIDSWGKTGIDKIWAGGDVSSDPRMVVHSIGAGKRAALSIHAQLRGESLAEIDATIRIGAKGSLSMERYLAQTSTDAPRISEVVKPEAINLDYFEVTPRMKIPLRSQPDRARGFEEVNLGYDEPEVRKELERCFHCGACDLCGICYRFCPDLSVKLGSLPGTNRFDEDHCKGCGICAQECPRSAILMERER